MFYGFGQDELSLEEIIKLSCPPPEEKPVEEKAKLAGFSWLGWLLLGGGLLYFLSEKNENEVLKRKSSSY